MLKEFSKEIQLIIVNGFEGLEMRGLFDFRGWVCLICSS